MSVFLHTSLLIASTGLGGFSFHFDKVIASCDITCAALIT
jgi:hypothetical protein